MWQAIGITLLIFIFLFSGIWVLKKTAHKFKVPKNVKAQPYEDDDD